MTLDTAKALRDGDDPRSCVSRAYYAAYQAATSVCILHGDTPQFPQNWNNPSHDQLPDLIANNGDLSVSERRTIRKALIELRAMRETADYRVTQTVDSATTERALTLAVRLFKSLEIDNDNIRN